MSESPGVHCKSPGIQKPTFIEDTTGHPSSVIVQTTCLLNELLIKADDDVSNVSIGSNPPRNKTPDLISTDTYHITGIKYAFENKTGSRDKVSLENQQDDLITAASRRSVLLLFKTLSILVLWEHNKAIFQSRLGSTFATSYIGITRFLINQLDDLTMSWISVKDNAIDVDSSALSDLRSDTSFVFSALVLISQFIAISCPSIHEISKSVSCGFLPPQPWRMVELQAFGYPSLLENSETSGDSTSSRRRFDSSDENLLGMPPILDCFCVSVQPLISNMRRDAWCGLLIAAGADYVIIDIVRKLSVMSKMLVIPPLSRSDANDGDSDMDNENDKNNKEKDCLSSEEKWTVTAYDIWKKCVVLQSEVLFALIGFVATHPVATSNRFLVCEGGQALNTMLLDSTTFGNKKNAVTSGIMFRRGVLCLRLNELVMHHCTESNFSVAFFPEALGWFFSWMRSTFNFTDDKFTSSDSELTENVVGCIDTFPHEISFDDSDLWPWVKSESSGGEDGRLLKENRQFAEPVSFSSCYRLCHQVDFGEYKLPAWDDKLNLEEWAIFTENAVQGQENEFNNDLPWFLRGPTARAWHVVFSILIYTTYEGGADSSKDMKRKRSVASFELIITAMFSTLGDVSDQCRNANSAVVNAPVFEMHVLLFIARCVHRHPVHVIEYFCDREEIWKRLFGGDMFLGGRDDIERAIDEIGEEDRRIIREAMQYSDLLHESISKHCKLRRIFSMSHIDENVSVAKGVSHKTKREVFSLAYMWFYLHDAILDLTTLLIRTANTPPTNRIISTQKGFEIKPIIQALQLSSEKGFDDVTFQLLQWMGWYLNLFSNKNISTLNFLSSHFFRAALAVCGYQLSDIGAYSILQKDSEGSPLFAKENSRLFMWYSRKAAIQLVNYIIEIPGCEKWVSLFLSKDHRDVSTVIKRENKTEGGVVPSLPTRKAKSKTPAHQTLLVLLLDRRLRNALLSVILKIVVHLMKEVKEESAQEVSSEDDRKGFFVPTKAASQNDSERSASAAATKSSTESVHSFLCSDAVKDIFFDLFEHVKCASRQPEWFDGSHAVEAILGAITDSLRSSRLSLGEMRTFQSFFRRGSLICELVCSSISCIHHARDSTSWNRMHKMSAVHHSLACLTAIMIDNNHNKAEFKSVMMAPLSRRGSSSKSDSKQLMVSPSKEDSGSASSIVIRYDEFTGMILETQDCPHFDTILVLFEMILDGPLYNSKSMSKKYDGDPTSILDGLFSDEFDRPLICNLSAIPIVFRILPKFEKNIQICVFNSFHSLIVGRNSLINISTCTSQMQPPLLDYILDLFPVLNEDVQQCAVHLLQTLGRHSISVSQLKRLFQLMQSKGDYRPVYTSRLVKSLLGMIDNEDSPRHSFVFSGRESGLEIPSIPRWPLTNAFTFSVWLRVESPLFNTHLRDSAGAISLSSNRDTLAKEYRPHILSLRAANGTGLEISLKKHSSNRSHKFRICIRCFDGKSNEPVSLMLPGKYIIEGKWHYLAVSHRSSVVFGKRNEVEIMLDDKFIRQKFPYPHFGDVIENPLIGECDEKFRGDDEESYNTTLRGQMSAIYLFADALTEGQLRGIYALGPSYFYSFEPYDTVNRDIPLANDKKITVDPVLSVLDSSLTSLIALAYNPAVWKHDLYLDNTPERNGVKWKSGNFLTPAGTFAQYGGEKNSHNFSKIDSPYYSPGRMHARGLPGTYRDITSDVRIALNSLGGIKALLPLFAQFDQPRFKPTFIRFDAVRHNSLELVKSESDENCPDVDKSFDADICLVVLELLHTLLVESNENEVLLRDIQATSLISYFLERMSPKHMSMKALDIFILIYKRVSWNSLFPSRVVEHILLNFRLWVFTPFEVQKRLLSTLEEILSSMHVGFLRDVNVVQLLLNALFLLYGYTKPDLRSVKLSAAATADDTLTQQRRSSYSTNTSTQPKHFLEAVHTAEKWINSDTGEVMGEKLAGWRLQFIRAKMLSLLEIIIRRGDDKGLVSPRDVSAVIAYTVSTESPRGKVEALAVLFSLLTGAPAKHIEANSARVLAGFASDRGLLSLLPLLSDRNMTVRLYTLLILCTSLTQAIVYDNIFDILNQDSFVLVDEVDERKSTQNVIPVTFKEPEDVFSVQIDSSERADSRASNADYSIDFPESDTLNALGLPIPSLVGVMLRVQSELMNAFEIDGHECEDYFITFQAKIITQAMLCTFIGESCCYLANSFDGIPIDDMMVNNAAMSELPDDVMGDSFDSRRTVESCVEALIESKSDFFESVGLNDMGGKDMTDQVICIPMLLPALLCIVRNAKVSLHLRLSAMVSLKSIILQCDDNTDLVLRISGWQDYFLQLLFELHKEREGILPSFVDYDRIITKYAALIDTALSTLCDIQVTAVRIGLCLGQMCVVSPLQRAEKIKLTPDQIFSETKSGERQLGVCVLRETMVLLKVYGDNLSDLELFINSTCFTLLQNIVNALQREYELVYPTYKNLCERNEFGDKKADQMKIYSYRILHLNQWLFGAIIVDFLDITDKNANMESKFDLNFSSDAWNLTSSLFNIMEYIKIPKVKQASISDYDKTVSDLALESKASWLSNKEIIERSVSGTIGVMIRILCAYLRLGNETAVESGENHIDEVKDYSKRALSQFNDLLTSCQDRKYDNLEYECTCVFARIILLLNSSKLSLSNEWIRGVIALLVRCMDESINILLRLIDSTIIDQSSNECFRSLLAKAIPSQLLPSSIRESISQNSDNDGTAFVNITLGPGSSVDVNVLLGGCDTSSDVKNATLNIVRQYLGLVHLNNFTWEYLVTFATIIVEETGNISDETKSDQFQGIGLHTLADDVGLQIQHQRVVSSNICEEVSVNYMDAYVCTKKKHCQLIEQHFRKTQSSERRVISKWNVIISGLANERGPWGFGSNQEVFWMMDKTETNSRMHYVMRRNEDGTRHQMATLLASTKGQSMVTENENLQNEDLMQSSGPDETAVLSSQNLWKHITKYHKSTGGGNDDLEPQDNEDEVVEGQGEDVDSSMFAVDSGKVLFEANVDIITAATNSAGGVTTGTLEVTKNKITFNRKNENENFDFVNNTKNTEFMWACQCFPSSTWKTMDIHILYHRHYQQRNCALEFFFTNRQTVFMVFADKPTARRLYTLVRRQIKPPHMLPHFGHKPISIMTRAIHPDSFRTVTQAWVYREISNFDYIMFCNTVAGRSYNDLSQYPIFPWVIANYTNSKLNLNDPKTYRDLKWSMGAQNESQREAFKRRYDDLAEAYYSNLEVVKKTGEGDTSDCLPPFHFGSHYSTMGFVLWYLVRYEPFTSLNIWMQDGRFDKTDRIFDTMEVCYKGVTNNQSDVKELIPEFYYCPEFLQNPNKINLGVTQGDTPKELGDVGLPPWAKTAKDFVRINRMALESEYVSANLHHWIDLIFGYKQRPPHLGGSSESVNACNVYFHLTYNGAVDLDNIKANDPALYEQITRQISNFGQTPSLLFRKPHPQRLPLSQVDMFWPLASVVLGADTILKGDPLPERPRRVVCFKEHKMSDWPIVLIGEIISHDKLITIDSSRIIGSHFWQTRPPDVVPPFQIKTDQAAVKLSQGIAANSALTRLTNSSASLQEKRIGVPFAPPQLLRADFVFDVSVRESKLPNNNKAVFEKEESLRSNWRVRGTGRHSSSKNTSKSPEKSRVSSLSRASRRYSLTSSPTPTSKDNSIVLQRVDEHVSNHLFALLPEHRILFSCGHWDNAIKVSSAESSRLMQSMSYHKDVVTCLDLATDFGNTWLVSGSRDCTVIVWEINPALDLPIISSPLHLLYGHDDAVNCVAINPEMDIVVSGSDDGTIIVHKLREGIYVRSISLENIPSTLNKVGEEKPQGQNNLGSPSAKSTNMISKCRIHHVLISCEGYLLAYSNDDMTLYTYTTNGEFVARKGAGERLHCFRMSEDNKVIVTGGERGLLVMRWVHSLELSNVGSKWEFDAVLDGSNIEEDQLPFNSPIRSIYMTKHERHLIVGLESGELRILAQVISHHNERKLYRCANSADVCFNVQDSDYLRKRLHSKLMEIGILEKIDINKFV